MDEAFQIRTPAQLRVLNAPATHAVVEALRDRDAAGGVSAGEVGARAGLSGETAHYHLKKLLRIGLVRVVGERETGARPEKRYALTARTLELNPGRRTPAYVREVVRGVRLLLRRAEREFARASSPGDGSTAFEIRPRVARHVGWLTPEEVEQIDRLEGRLGELLRKAERRAAAEGRAGRERVAITMTLSPVERHPDG